MIGAKPFRIRFDKADAFIKDYDGTRYLVIILDEKRYFICRIRYRIGLKIEVMYVVSQNYAKIKIYWYYSLHLKKTWTLHNVIIHIKSVFIKDKKNYCYKILIEKYSYQLKKLILIKQVHQKRV